MKVKCLSEIRADKKKEMYSKVKEEMREDIEHELIVELTDKVTLHLFLTHFTQ